MIKRNILIILTILIINAQFCLSQEVNSIETVLQKGHSRYVSCVAYSPDGKFIVTGSYDNTLKLWNASNGKEIRTFSNHTGYIRTVYFSPDGKKILSSSEDNQALIYDITTGKVITQIVIKKDRLFKACYSPDGSMVLTSDDRDKIVVWDATSGENLGEYKKSYGADISSQWFGNQSNTILSYARRDTANLVDIKSGSKVHFFEFDKPYSFSLSSDGKYAAIGSEKLFAGIYSIETGKKLHRIKDDEEKNCDGCKTLVQFSHNSKYFATANRYSGVSIWDPKSGKRLKNFPMEEDWISEIVFSPGDKYIMAVVDDESFVWEIKSGKKIFQISSNKLECTPVFSPDESLLLTSNENNTAALWTIPSDHNSSPKKIKIFSGYLNKKRDDGLKYDQSNLYHSSIIRFLELKSKISLSPDGKYIAKANTDSVALLINIETGKIEKVFKGHSKMIFSTDFSSDGKTLLTAGGDGYMKLWDVESGKEIKTIMGHREVVFDARFSSDDNFIISGSWDGSFRIWNVKTGKMHKNVNLKNVAPYCLDFTPNDLYIVVADLGKKVKLYETDACEEFRDIVGHTDIVASICFTKDEKKLVTAGFDGKVKVWDLLSGMLLNKFSNHTSGVYSVACDPNGKYIASGSNDRTIKIWDINTGKEIKTLTGHSGAVTSIKITNDGKKIVSCSIDGEIKVWSTIDFREIYTYIQINRQNWLAKNPEGYFDGSPDALKLINYVSGLDVITVNSLFEKFYTPNLISRINSGELFAEQTTNLNSIIKNTPTIDFRIIPENNLIDVANLDSITWFKNTIPIKIDITDQGGGVDELRIYNNGKLILSENLQNSQVRAGKKLEKSLDIPIASGNNKLTAIALSKDRTESLPINLNVFYDGIESDINLYILSVGINKYENPAYELAYAINDAKSYAKLIKKGAEGIFKSIEEIFIKDSEADKETIKKTFTEIAKKAGPEDVFIFYFAGHGAMSVGSQAKSSDFYIIPYDVTNMYGDEALLNERAISAEEILELSKQISARKQLFILDACQSGGALTAFNTRGAGREKAIAQLARSTGTYFLLASGAIQYASESKELGHGIFTYAILEALEGKADGGSLDAKITANELKSYVEDRVPELTRQYMLTPQYPTGYSFGQDFPIVMVK